MALPEQTELAFVRRQVSDGQLFEVPTGMQRFEGLVLRVFDHNAVARHSILRSGLRLDYSGDVPVLVAAKLRYDANGKPEMGGPRHDRHWKTDELRIPVPADHPWYEPC